MKLELLRPNFVNEILLKRIFKEQRTKKKEKRAKSKEKRTKRKEQIRKSQCIPYSWFDIAIFFVSETSS